MGYLRAGRILRVNLTTRRTSTDPTADYDRFIGGKGINLKLLFDGVTAGTDPLGPDNLLLVGSGMLAGTPFPASCRMDVMAKSPVTGNYGNSGMGGYFGPEMKFAGYDNIAIEGRADGPVYLYIKDDLVEIREATDIWGSDTYETPTAVRKDAEDPAAQVICIGPAGENEVVYSGIMSGTGNVAARTGLGAVMGSKNLKAIAVRGTKGLKIAKPKEFLASCRDLLEAIRGAMFYEEIHTIGFTRIHDREMRDLYELLGVTWPGQENISEFEFMKDKIKRRVGCFACPMACFDAYNIEDIGSGTSKCSPPGDLSWDLKNNDLAIAWKAYMDCQRYGLDARSLANALAWLMKLHEEGIITDKDMDGLPMEWGSTEAISLMAEKISLRQGIGDLLAKGLPAAAKEIGGGAENYLIMAKGSPSDLHVPPLKTTALAAAVSPIGEDAQVQPFEVLVPARRWSKSQNEEVFQEKIKKYKDRAEKKVGIREAADPRTIQGKAALVRKDEERTDIIDMTGVCGWMTPFMGLPVDTAAIARCMTLGLGDEVIEEDLIEAATRIRHLERAFTGKCGLNREDDRVSKGYYGRIRPGGRTIPELGSTEAELEQMKDDYYRIMGWDLETGLPTRETLINYDLADVADDLEGREVGT